jgi:uncharacterized membrane protein YoaK (UPF0700 family)
LRPAPRYFGGGGLMRNLVLSLVVVVVIGVMGYYVIQWFRIPDPALLILGVLLLAALVLTAFHYWPDRGGPL